jgi:HD-like signal output (HDOD) protein
VLTTPATAGSEKVIQEAAERLPGSWSLLAQLGAALRDAPRREQEIRDALRQDSALAGAVVQVANRGAFPGPRVATVDEVVARVGVRELPRVVGLAALVRSSALALPCYGVPGGALSRSCLLHALALESLAPAIAVDQPTAFLTALLRPLGLIVINQAMRAQCDTTRFLARSRDLLAMEREWVGRTNPEVAALVLERGQVAPVIVQAVRDHYLLNGWQAASRLSVALNLAGAIAAALGGALRPERDLWLANPSKLAAIGLTEEEFLAAQERTTDEYQRLRPVLR